MQTQRERRSGGDRRESAAYCHFGSERRELAARRRIEMADGQRGAGMGSELGPDYWGASEDESTSE